MSIQEGRAKAESVRQLSPVLLRIVLRQGLKRQIRQMLYKLGYEVERLIRIRIGPLRLTALRAGEWRALTEAEVKSLASVKEPPAARPAASKGKAKGAADGPARSSKPGSATPRAKGRPGRNPGPGGKRSASPRRVERRQPSSGPRFTGDSAASAPTAARRP
jgi:23S rRNA pseudouridine2605 synthase